jgi:hypothetical protein
MGRARGLGRIVGVIGAGKLAGAVGTLGMDALWYRRYRQGGGEDGFPAWELSTGVDSFDDAPAPARVGQHVAGLVGVQIPDRLAGATNVYVHWVTGVGWGALAGLLAAARVKPVRAGVAVGAAAFAASYAVLPRIGVYQPFGEYDAETLFEDATAHLLYGATTGVALALLRSVRG